MKQTKAGERTQYVSWYSNTKPDALQGLIYEESTGKNLAVSYDPKDAPLIAAAPDSDRILRVIRDWMKADANEIYLGTLMQDDVQGEQTIGEAIHAYFERLQA